MPSPVWRWVREQRAFLAVLLILAAGFIYLVFQPSHWRRGTGVMAVALLAAAVLRVCLRAYDAGLLAVRRKWVDAVCYLVIGGCILAVDIRLHS